MRYAFLAHHIIAGRYYDNPTIIKYYHQALLILFLRCNHPFGSVSTLNSYITALKTHPREAWRHWSKHLADMATPSSGLWIAVKDDKVVAVAHQISFYIDRIATHPSENGKGYMKGLLQHVTDYYKYVANDIPISAPVNLDVISLFEKHGWEIMLNSKHPKVRRAVTSTSTSSRAMYPTFSAHVYRSPMIYPEEKFFDKSMAFHSRLSINAL